MCGCIFEHGIKDETAGRDFVFAGRKGCNPCREYLSKAALWSGEKGERGSLCLFLLTGRSCDANRKRRSAVKTALFSSNRIFS